MKIGIDIDGVLANFVASYQPLFVKVTGRDLFQPGDIENPPVWDWPALRGYTTDETKAVWDVIVKDEQFWFNLHPFNANCTAIRDFFYTGLANEHEVYFITNRPGVQSKAQTEEWLANYLNLFNPTVLVIRHREKGSIAKALQLDAHIDDNYDNCCDVVRCSPKTRSYVLDRSYNQPTCPEDVFVSGAVEQYRMQSVASFLHQEGLIK